MLLSDCPENLNHINFSIPVKERKLKKGKKNEKLFYFLIQ